MSERMIERDEAWAARLVDESVNKIRTNVPKPGTNTDPYCADCGEEIVAARRQLGYTRCIHCAEFGENRRG